MEESLLKHIVLWKLKEHAGGVSRNENARELKRRLENLKSLIPDIVELKVGFDFRESPPSYEICLDSLFKDERGLENYQKHPEHLKVAAFVKEVTSERAAVDYVTDSAVGG
jgi:hypothetical protein